MFFYKVIYFYFLLYSTYLKDSKFIVVRYEKTYLNCVETVKPVRDTLDRISVKWELHIIILVSIGNNEFTAI